MEGAKSSGGSSGRQLLEPQELTPLERKLLVGKAAEQFTKRPEITAVPRSSLLDRARSFLPQLAAANNALQQELQARSFVPQPASLVYARIMTHGPVAVAGELTVPRDKDSFQRACSILSLPHLHLGG